MANSEEGEGGLREVCISFFVTGPHHPNHKKLMVINNLQTEFNLLIVIVLTRDSKNIVIFAQIARFIFMRAYVRSQPSDSLVFHYAVHHINN